MLLLLKLGDLVEVGCLHDGWLQLGVTEHNAPRNHPGELGKVVLADCIHKQLLRLLSVRQPRIQVG